MPATVETKDGPEQTPKNAVEAPKVQKQPPPETAESILTRRYILLSFWALALFLGLPIWWKTTTVYRAPLPHDQMLEWADGKVRYSTEDAHTMRH
jgi:phosphatidylinositol glycan class S